MKKLWIVLGLIALSAISCAQQKDVDEWIDITPGLDLEGWTIINIPPGEPLNDVQQWSADSESKILRCEGNGGHEWLRYDAEEFTDIVFHVEWKFDTLEGDAKYNSGIYVRNNADGTIWHQGQIGGGSGGFMFGVSPVNGENAYTNTQDQLSTSPVKPAGEWNVCDITSIGKTISMVVNGTPTVVWDLLEVPSGFVGLEAEGYAVEFRNLKVKKLNDSN